MHGHIFYFDEEFISTVKASFGWESSLDILYAIKGKEKKNN